MLPFFRSRSKPCLPMGRLPTDLSVRQTLGASGEEMTPDELAALLRVLDDRYSEFDVGRDEVA